jgi:hypothetical protein
MKIKWLDRRIAAPGPYLCLVLSEEAYKAAMAHCRIERPDPWVDAPAHARTYMLENPEMGQVAVIGMRDWQGRSSIEVAGLLVHEAVHVWQEYADRIGERHPGAEQEAYAIQAIAQELMAEFARQVGAV